MPSTYTPLRYPGGKTKLYNDVQPFLCALGDDTIYVEPFAGGAGLALKLLFCGDAKSIILNDIDENIYLFWRACILKTNVFCQLIEDVPLTMDEWEKQKNTLENPQKYSDLERAFALFYLNRCNRSGIIKGGPIGGKKQDGKYKIDARFNKEGLIRKINKIGKNKDKISVYCEDGKHFLNNVCKNLPYEKTLINIDPPYVNKGPALYQNSFSREDHEELSKVIKQLRQRWIVTYDTDELIEKLYSGFIIREIQLSYSAGEKRKIGKEYLISNFVTVR